MEHLGSHLTVFMKFDILGFIFFKSAEQIPVPLISDKHNWHCT